MQKLNLSYQNKILQQFESYPYPNVPIEESPKNNLKLLYESSFVTARYRRDKRVITDLENRVMLDIACGTGATTLTMAIANPGAKIIGVDISPESIKVAEERLKYHGFSNVTFQVLAIEKLEQLATKFDYICASDVLYLLPDLSLALEQLGKVLKPDGIIRANLHSLHQRVNYYRAQELFKRMGLMDSNPEATELQIVRDFFSALKDQVNLKVKTWQSADYEKDDERILMNHLFQNDKGYTLPQLFDALSCAQLELISMVDWQHWDWRELFKAPDNLPTYLALGLENADVTEQLAFYELVEPNKRLLDFWCGHPQIMPNQYQSKADWQELDPSLVMIYCHPCLQSEAFQKAVLDKQSLIPLNLGDFFSFLVKDAWIDRTIASIIFVPLLSAPCSLAKLVDRWLEVKPVNAVTLERFDRKTVAQLLQSAIADQEALGILLVAVED
jgi:ubiquinone/menaquinone biosynthesis C-methylase UbiE